MAAVVKRVFFFFFFFFKARDKIKELIENGRIARCLSSPCMDFSTRNCPTFLGKYIGHNSGEIPGKTVLLDTFPVATMINQ